METKDKRRERWNRRKSGKRNNKGKTPRPENQDWILKDEDLDDLNRQRQS